MSDSEGETYGPCRPSQPPVFIGPVVPAALKVQHSQNGENEKIENKTGAKDENVDEKVDEEEKVDEKVGEEEKDDGDIIGPLPPSKSSADSGEDVIRLMEERAERMRKKLLNPVSWVVGRV